MFEIQNTIFYEKINFVKLKLILNNRKDFEDIIEKDKDVACDKKMSIWTILKKMYKSVNVIPFSQYGYIPVKYHKSSCNIGRWYCNDATGLASIKKCVRGAICDDVWVDIDQINSHPCILKQIMKKYEYSSPLLNKYVENRDEVLNDIMIEEGLSKDNAKDAVISVLNGKKYKSKTLMTLQNELKIPVDFIMKCDEYIHIYNYCKNTFGDKSNLWGKTMSRILQFEENKMLECYLEYCYDNGLIEKYKNGFQVALIFDGFQLIKNDDINDDLLDKLRQYALDKTGFDVKLKYKPFDNSINIPDELFEAFNNDPIDDDDVEDEFIDDSIKSYEDTKIEFEKTHCKIMFPPCIYTINDNKDFIESFKQAKDSFSHINCYIIVKKKKTIRDFFSLWIKDPNIRKYNIIEWKPPPLLSNENNYNTWIDFDIVNTPNNNTDRNYYKEFLTYCYNLFETKEVANYILARYAFRLQNAGLKSKVCFIFYGQEGAGKSTFIDTIYKLFGKYAIQIDKAKKMYESHSTFEKEKCLICVNEASGTDNFENSDVLKTRITESKLYINPKGIQAYEIDNICDYDMTTNNINVVKITDDSTRRWFQTEVTNFYLGDVDFFTDYNNNILQNDDALKQIYNGLVNFNWKDIVKSGNFQDPIYKPTTHITEIVKLNNRDKLIWFFNDITSEYINNNNDDTEFKLSNNELFDRWNDWCNYNKVKYECNNVSFGIKVNQLNKLVFSKIKCDFIDNHSHYKIINCYAFKNFIDKLTK